MQKEMLIFVTDKCSYKQKRLLRSYLKYNICEDNSPNVSGT